MSALTYGPAIMRSSEATLILYDVGLSVCMPTVTAGRVVSGNVGFKKHTKRQNWTKLKLNNDPRLSFQSILFLSFWAHFYISLECHAMCVSCCSRLYPIRVKLTEIDPNNLFWKIKKLIHTTYIRSSFRHLESEFICHFKTSFRDTPAIKGNSHCEPVDVMWQLTSTICWSVTTTTARSMWGVVAGGRPLYVTSRGCSTSPDVQRRCVVSSWVVALLQRSVSVFLGPPRLRSRRQRWLSVGRHAWRACEVCAWSGEQPCCPVKNASWQTSTTTKQLSAARRLSTDSHLVSPTPPSLYYVSRKYLCFNRFSFYFWYMPKIVWNRDLQLCVKWLFNIYSNLRF